MIPRLALAAAALLMLLVAVLHSLGTVPLAADLEAAELRPFIVGAFRAVWLGFSLTSVALAVVFAVVAIRLQPNITWLVIVLAAIPLGSAVLIYVFVGSFFGAHLLLGSGALAVIGSLWPRAANKLLQATREDARA